ncbi:hypothetical protein [Nostoc punctiforme]|uniref:Uncharacterized protein n=1 Tax=Nostoc punctiforme NIES-2108 TaxID=1356359 RepID=A0A367R0W6_NOSPU|nr:hypothetical protein [Nostoc punctiforme]RCJ29194.1 hypothetical protein A6769_35965 [Nostoc punctiforme NIES-2108]
MQIKITQPDTERYQMWFNNFVEQVFDVVEVVDGIPKQYAVDVSQLVQQGLMAQSSRGIAYVPFAFAQEIII